MSKLCCIFNVPSLYREEIYKRIDQRYDCSWYFEDVTNNLNTFDIKTLKDASILRTKRLLGFYWVKKQIGLLFRREYKIFLMIGPSRCLSIFFFLLLKRLFFPKKKSYLWTHGYYGKETKIERFWKKCLFKLANGIFLYGNYSRDLMIKDGFLPSKLYTIHNSLSYSKQLELRNSIKVSDIYMNHFSNSDPVLIFIGRLMPVKQLDLLLKAVSILCKKNYSCNTIFVGDGPEKNTLTCLAEKLGIKQKVWFYGACYDESKNAELVYNADLCIAPGNVGLTAMHSMMFGCPVISHNDFAYQMPEFEAIHKGETGDFYEYGSVDSLADAIHLWMKNHHIGREKVREACYKEIDTQWNPHYQMKVIESVIGNCL